MSDPGKILDELAPLFDAQPGESSVRGNPEAARVAARLLYVDGLLHEAFSEATRARSSRPRGLYRWIGTGLAAAAGLAAILVWLTGRPAGSAPIAHFESADQVTAGGRSARAGDALYPGDEIRVSGSATLRAPDGTRLDLKTGTRARLAAKVFVSRGTVEARVTPQAPGRPLVLATPHGEALVLGTTLRLTVGSASTRLDVEEGKVRFTRTEDAQAVDVTAGHFAVAASGLDLSPRRVTKGAAFAARMAPNSWLAIPDTAMRPVAVTKKEYPKVFASLQGPAAMFTRSGGGALDTRRNRLYVWGGGFTHYHGNELYAFDLEEFAWLRVTEPHPNPSLNEEVNPDGTPVSRDVFGGFTYIAHADRLFACGGFLAGGGAVASRFTWTFDPESRAWRNMNPSGALPSTGPYNSAVYDPVSKKVWWGDANSGGRGPGLYSYDLDTNSWTKHTSHQLSHYGAALDTRRRQLVFAGRGAVFSYDLRSPLVPRTYWQTSGGKDFLQGEHVGFDYDPVSDRFAGWDGGSVYVLDPEKKTWIVLDPPGAPARRSRDVLGRWRYVPSLGAFVAAFGIDENVHLFKLPE